MTHRAGTAQDPINIGSQASQQVVESSQYHALNVSIQQKLAKSTSIEVALHNLKLTPRPRPSPPTSESPTDFEPLPFPQIIELQKKPHPKDPIQTSFQRTMLDNFRSFGRWGLVDAIYKFAKRQRPHKSWQIVIDDVDERTYYMYQLTMLLPNNVIESLIQNTLPYDYVRDKDVKRFVNQHMNVNLSSYPGIYINILTHAANQIGYRAVTTTKPGFEGEWLTSKEVEGLLDRVKKYVENEEENEAENSSIDNHWKSSKAQISHRCGNSLLVRLQLRSSKCGRR